MIVNRSVFSPLVAFAVLITLAVPFPLAAQAHKAAAPRYRLYDLGTLGGPQSGIPGPSVRLLNGQGMAIGIADTTTLDNDYPKSNPTIGPDRYIQHAILRSNGRVINLGALPGNNSSFPNYMNSRGIVAGQSENGDIDPLMGYPEARAVVWTRGRIVNLGSLGGNESAANAINNKGQVVGLAANAIPDPLSIIGWGTQTRGFLWQHGRMRDIGTLTVTR